MNNINAKPFVSDVIAQAGFEVHWYSTAQGRGEGWFVDGVRQPAEFQREHNTIKATWGDRQIRVINLGAAA